MARNRSRVEAALAICLLAENIVRVCWSCPMCGRVSSGEESNMIQSSPGSFPTYDWLFLCLSSSKSRFPSSWAFLGGFNGSKAVHRWLGRLSANSSIQSRGALPVVRVNFYVAYIGYTCPGLVAGRTESAAEGSSGTCDLDTQLFPAGPHY